MCSDWARKTEDSGEEQITLIACWAMRKETGTDWMSLLPDEIVAEILLRLPAGDVVQSKSVCKLWYELITNSRFAETHLRHWTDRGEIAGKMFFSRDVRQLFCHSLDDDSGVQSFDMPLDGSGIVSCISKLWHDSVYGSCLPQRRDPRVLHVDSYNIIDACDGLLLTRIHLHDQERHEYVFFVCNPETRLGILLPAIDRYGMLSFYRGHIIYDPSVQKYKVVGTNFECLTDKPDNPDYLYSFHLIELDRGKHQSSPWKVLKVPREEEKGKVIAGVGMEGKLHLLRKVAKSVPLRLLTLDLATEEFEARDCSPTPFPRPKYWARRIFGSNRMFYHMVSVSQNEFDLWSLRDLKNPIWFCHRVMVSSPLPPPYWDDSFVLIKVLKDDSKLVFFSRPKRTFFTHETTSGKCRSIPIMEPEDTALLSERRTMLNWSSAFGVSSLINWNRGRNQALVAI